MEHSVGMAFREYGGTLVKTGYCQVGNTLDLGTEESRDARLGLVSFGAMDQRCSFAGRKLDVQGTPSGRNSSGSGCD